MRNLFAWVLIVFCLPSAVGAGISCYKASTTQEKLICADPTILALDAKLSGLYAVGVQIVKPVEALKREQHAWLKEARDACSDSACLVSVYQRRIDALVTLLNRHTVPMGSLLNVEKRYPVERYVPMCKGAKDGGFFSVALIITEDRVTGTLDGVYNCGVRMWGPVEAAGRPLGHLAEVEFNGGYFEKGQAKALVAVTKGNVYWYTFQTVKVDGYIPEREVFRLESPKPRLQGGREKAEHR